jgi:hypothetical protein
MTRRDQELLNKQLWWLKRSHAEGLLGFSVISAILICVLLASVSVA